MARFGYEQLSVRTGAISNDLERTITRFQGHMPPPGLRIYSKFGLL